MKRVITVSRYTDVPAFYGSWFMNRLADGFAGWEPPDGGPRRWISLRREDVLAFVFWSRNYRFFLRHLLKLRELGYPCLFHCSVTVLPPDMDRGTIAPEHAVDIMKQMAAWFSPGQLSWRYEPILVTDRTPPHYHVQAFERLASALRGHVTRAQIRFLVRNADNEIHCLRFEHEIRTRLIKLSADKRLELARCLGQIASRNGMTLQTCCDPTLVSSRLQPGCCLDRDLLARIGGDPEWKGEPANRQSGCGCVASVDIGRPGTCPHGCFHCLDNLNKPQAALAYRAHDATSAFLGLGKAESDQTFAEVRAASGDPSPGSDPSPASS